MKVLRFAGMLLGLGWLSCFPQCANAQTQHNIKTVWIILMENHNWSQIKGSRSAPYINNTLLPMASHAEQYFNPPGIHPSLLIICGWRRGRTLASWTIMTPVPIL